MDNRLEESPLDKPAPVSWVFPALFLGTLFTIVGFCYVFAGHIVGGLVIVMLPFILVGLATLVVALKC